MYREYKRQTGEDYDRHSPEPIRKKRKPLSETTKRKISEQGKGQESWNKGIPCESEVKRKISLAKRGQEPWNKGKKGKKLSTATKRKISLAKKGKKHSTATRKKISIRNRNAELRKHSAEICRLYQESNEYSSRKLAKMFGCAPKTIRRILKENGVPLRNRSEAQKKNQ